MGRGSISDRKYNHSQRPMQLIKFIYISLILFTIYGCKIQRKENSKISIQINDSLMHSVKIDSLNKPSLDLIFNYESIEECKYDNIRLKKYEHEIYMYLQGDSGLRGKRLYADFEKFHRQYLIFLNEVSVISYFVE
jgi:hypothetical protein